MAAFTNFAKGRVIGAYGATDATIRLAAGQASRFASPPFNATWWNASDYPDPSDDPFAEIVTVAGVTGDYLQIVRGAEGTAPTAKNIPGKLYCFAASITAGMLNQLLQITISTDFAIANGSAWLKNRTTGKYQELYLDSDGGVNLFFISDQEWDTITVRHPAVGSLYGHCAALNGTVYFCHLTTGLYYEGILDQDNGVPVFSPSDVPYSAITAATLPDGTLSGNFCIFNGNGYGRNRTTGLYHQLYLEGDSGAATLKISDETLSP